MGLNFTTLREVNVARCIEGWKHPLDGWTLDEWLIAVAGEMGEALNVVKKLNRARDNIIGNDKTIEELRGMLADELADTAIYLDLLLAAASGQPFCEMELTPAGFNRLATEVGGHRSAEVADLVQRVGALALAISDTPFPSSLESRQLAAEDTLDQLDVVANLYGIDLSAAIISKFNRTSEKHGMPHRLPVEASDAAAKRVIEGEPEPDTETMLSYSAHDAEFPASPLSRVTPNAEA